MNRNWRWTRWVVIGLILCAFPSWVCDGEESEIPDLKVGNVPPADDVLTDLMNDESDSPNSASNTGVEPKANLEAKPVIPSELETPAPEVEIPNELEIANPGARKTPKTVMQEPPLPAAERGSGPAPYSGRNEITNLEFKMEGETSRILLSSPFKLNYREANNRSIRQNVYLFQNTQCPQRLQRAYDTTEFMSVVAYFTLLQMPRQEPPVCKLIVQMREDKAPNVTNTERGLFIDFAPPEQKNITRGISTETSKLSYEENGYNSAASFSGKAIDLEIKNSDIQDVLRLIGRSSGYNVVIGDDVQGKVGTLSLRGIPWDQAMALVLQSKKLGYVRQGNVLRIATLGSLKSEKDEVLAAELSRVKAEPLRTVLLPVSYAKAAELAPRAKTFLSDRGSVDTDDRTNTLVLRDVDRVVNKVQKLISLLDVQPPRVTITARFVEINRGLTRNLGLGRSRDGSASLRFGASTSGVDFDQAVNSTVGGPATTVISAASLGRVNATIALGETNGDAKVLASPSIAISSNQRGTISSGQSFTVFTPGANGGPATPTTITANLTLNITPIVSSDGSISMAVNLNNDILASLDPQPTINTRTINTNLLVQDGDTAVIGGVFRNEVRNDSSGVPFLMKIPILGFFFGGTTTVDNRVEMLIFLTAKITNAEDAFKNAI